MHSRFSAYSWLIRTRLLAAVKKGEIVLWHQQYLRCCEELSQWEPISDYARQTEHYALLMDCLWRANDWHTLKQEVLPKAQARPRAALPLYCGSMYSAQVM